MIEINKLKKNIFRELEEEIENIPFKKDDDKANAMLRVLFTLNTHSLVSFNSIELLLIDLKEKVGKEDVHYLVTNTEFIDKYLDVAEKATFDSISRIRGEIFLAKQKIEELNSTIS
jgi:hypothetical protein